MQLGMIGLGRMGANLVRRLVADGHSLQIVDLTTRVTIPAGTLQSISKSKAAVGRYAKRSPHKNAVDNEFRSLIGELEYSDDGTTPKDDQPE